MGGDHLVPHRIRTVALLGQGGAGKTALGEGLLTAAGAASRGGVLDSAEERERGHSLSLSTAAFDWRECRVHVIDTPGTPDFAGEAYPALSGADCALFVVDAVDGVQPVHDALWERCDALGLPRIVVLSGLDKERAGTGVCSSRRSLRPMTSCWRPISRARSPPRRRWARPSPTASRRASSSRCCACRSRPAWACGCWPISWSTSAPRHWIARWQATATATPSTPPRAPWRCR
ncbi:MAG: hypothetical protein BRC31_08305 [Actinobacteria bacterium QS_5_72_10]|nr:MAG: hypothetical protein BRC31_08305 [Actinobacteria bacterium QS_5_72_10]